MQDPSYILVSLGRCGTTLTQQIINAHPHLYLTDECHWIPPVISAGLSFYRFVEVDDLSPTTIPADSRWWEGVRAMHRELFREQAGKTWGIQFIGKPNLAHLKTLLEVYPDAKIVLLRRDLRDLYISLLRTGIGYRTAADDLAFARQLIIDQNRQWFDLSYESLCTQPVETICALCGFLEVPVSERMLDVLTVPISHGEKPALAKDANGHYSVSSDVAVRWPNLLAPEELIFLNDQCTSLARIGYPVYQGKGLLISPSTLKEEQEVTYGFSIDFNAVSRNEAGQFCYPITVNSVGVIGRSGDLSGTVEFNGKSLNWHPSQTFRLRYIDLRDQLVSRVNRYDHKNSKPIYTLPQAFEIANPYRVWLCGTESETENFLNATKLPALLPIAGIIELGLPTADVAFGIKTVTPAAVSPAAGEIVLIPTIRLYAAARKIMAARGFTYGENLFLVQ